MHKSEYRVSPQLSHMSVMDMSLAGRVSHLVKEPPCGKLGEVCGESGVCVGRLCV